MNAIIEKTFQWKAVRATGSFLVLCIAALFLHGVPAAPANAFQDNNGLKDQDIRSAIEFELMTDEIVPYHLIDVRVSEGICTLAGSVHNLLAKERALTAAQTVKGVRSVINEISVTPIKRPDEQIRKDIENALFEDPAVDSYFEKARAENIASHVKGVVEIANRLTVGAPWTWKADWEIEQDIERELVWNPFIDRSQISVIVEDGVADLTGTVDTWFERQKATEEAYEGGAKSVDNNLKVESGPKKFQPES